MRLLLLATLLPTALSFLPPSFLPPSTRLLSTPPVTEVKTGEKVEMKFDAEVSRVMDIIVNSL